MRALRFLRWGLFSLVALLVLALALLAGAWLWGGSGTSLAVVLSRVALYLPADQSLEVSGVTGSLRFGGHIDTLRWRRGELRVEAENVDVGWSLPPLWDRELRISHLRVGQLRIDDRRAPTPAKNSPAPLDLGLPMRVSVHFVVDSVQWKGPPALVATGVVGSYGFDSKQHSIDVGQVHIASGVYALQARLQSTAPMALVATVDGSVDAPVPSSDKRVLLKALVRLEGEMATPDAALTLHARLRSDTAGQRTASPKATVDAQLQPWKVQPLAQAQVVWEALDLATLWPQAPRTLLSGQASVAPAGATWRGTLDASNAVSGPWNTRALPLQSLQAEVVFDKGSWLLQTLRAQGAGGELQARGEADAAVESGTATGGASGAWKLTASARGINPHAVDTRLDVDTLNGDLTAAQTPAGIRFDAQLQGARKQVPQSPDKPQGLRLQAAQARGLWRAPTLQLDSLLLQTSDATVEGKLTVQTHNFATEGNLALRLPGLQSTVSGHLSDQAGEGTLQLTLSDAALATQWLARLPGDPAHLLGLRLQGTGDLKGQWQGGWHKQARALQFQAQLRTPRLDLFRDPKATEPALGLRDTQLVLSGNLGALDLQVATKVHAANQQFAVQSRMQGGQEADGQWQGRMDSATVTAREAGSAEIWTASLAQPVQATLKQDATRQTLAVSAGALALTGPVPGAAELKWEAAQWSSVVSGKAVQTAWSTRGSLRDLPVGWLERIGKTQLANLGLRGDLVLGGQWEASSAQDLNLKVVLERTAGDLRLLGPDAQAATLSAGLRDTRLVLTAHNESLAATLTWDSQRAGQLNATASTRLPVRDGRWVWDPDAPLEGKLSASLPPVGVWSLLAPPGWRLNGSVESDAVLSGTLGTPLWRGNLRAKDMAVRSVVDGIDFSQGTLNAQLDGQRLVIQEFSIRGAGGAQAGQLVLKGAVEWLPPQPQATALSRLRMELDATLASLRVSARADRRLALSGKLTARLANAQLVMRGDLKADEALIILPDDTAPQLGKDVVVRGRTNADAASPASTAPAKPITPDLAITLDLGPNFYVKGRGLSTRLAGQLALTSSADTKGQPRLNGTVRTVLGTYLAYGQRLDIEEGELRFTGPYDNPTLNVLALRSKLTQRVGVQINGTALAPVVRLYAEPDLPEAEKLAWLVLGRSPAGGGAETALLQQAALALMGSKNNGTSASLAQRVGLDELSVGGGSNAGQADGTGAGGAALTVGKRLSQDFYVAYETGLAGAVGTLQMFYDLSRRFSLRASTGTQSAVDLVFTHRYD